MSSFLSATSLNEIDFIEHIIETKPENSVTIRMVASGISSGTEKNILQKKTPSFFKHWDNPLRLYRQNGSRKTYPVFLGYETIGKVVKIGNKVKNIHIGDLIWADLPHTKEAAINEQKAINGLLPKDIDPHIGVFLPLTRVALGAVHDAKIKIGDNVVVFGQGVMGILCAQLSKLAGANVVGVDINTYRLQYTQRFGIPAMNSKNKDIGLQLRKFFPRGADVAIEASGTYDGLIQSIRACGITGNVVTLGSYPTETHTLNFGEEWHKNRISMISSMTINNCPHPQYPLWDLQRLNKASLSLLYKKQIQVLPLISHIIPIQQSKKAYKLLLQPNSKTMKIVFSYNT